jgi:hypothetical protein
VLLHLGLFILSACGVYALPKASFTAEEASQEGMNVDEAKNERVQELEALLQEYKSTNFQLTREIDALGGDSVSVGHGPTRQTLSAEVELQRVAKLDVERGSFGISYSVVGADFLPHCMHSSRSG